MAKNESELAKEQMQRGMENLNRRVVRNRHTVKESYADAEPTPPTVKVAK